MPRRFAESVVEDAALAGTSTRSRTIPEGYRQYLAGKSRSTQEDRERQRGRCSRRVLTSDWRPEDRDFFLARHDTPLVHYEHRFFPDEIEAEAREAGLRVAFHARPVDGTLVLTA